MIKKLLIPLTAIVFVLQARAAFAQTYTITATETVYSGGIQTTNLLSCNQDSVVYRITESPRTNDTIYIKLPHGITFGSMLLSDSNVTVTGLRFQDSTVAFYDNIISGSTSKISFLINTPPCNSQHSFYQYTAIWGYLGTNTYLCNTDNLVILSPELKAIDISWPHPSIDLTVGGVDEFIYALTNFSVGTKISKIYFNCTPNTNIVFYPDWYLTSTASVPSVYYNKYTYNLPSTHYPLIVTNIIDSLTIDSLIGHYYLQIGDTVFLHVPFSVKSCDSGNGHFEFYTLCPSDSTSPCNLIINPTHISIPLGNPILYATTDTIDNATYCSEIGKDSERVKFMYINNPSTYFATPPGNGRADSLRLFLGCNTLSGHIDNMSIKINDVPISTTYITTRTDGIYTLTEIDLTHYPANPITGLAFGNNTIQDWDGNGYADAIAEGDGFNVTATFIYDTVSCFPFTQCPDGEATLSLPFIEAKYNNECFSIDTSDLRVNSNLLNMDAAYNYSTQSGASTMTTPNDIIFGSEFPMTICPSYVQQWTPNGWGFDCPNAYFSMNVALPPGYSIDTNDHSILQRFLADANSQHSNLYKYVPVYTDSGGCPLKVDTIIPLFQEYYNYPNIHDTTLIISFGKLDTGDCGGNGSTFLLSCINIPMILACNPAQSAGYSDTVPFTFQYTCDSACAECADILTCGSTITYNHPCGICSSIPQTSDSLLTIFRTNTGYINQNLPAYYTRSCDSSPLIVPSIHDTLITKSGSVINLEAAYPGDQVETTVNGGYDSLTPENFDNEYLQIRYPVYSGSNHKGYLFELDPTLKSYFIIHGCSFVPSLNGDTLIIPANRPFYTDTSNSTEVEMNFSIDSAMNNSFPTLYSRFITDTLHEVISVSAHLHLRVWNPGMSTSDPYILSAGRNIINLRNEYMAVVKSSGDSLHSCDSWGSTITILQPKGNKVGIITSNYPNPSTCDSMDLYFGFDAGAISVYSDDFPNEFRPMYELDSVVSITAPAGYLYDGSTFSTYIDNYNANPSDNYFSGGAGPYPHVFPIRPVSNSNSSNNPSFPTTLQYIGLDNSCWPLIDQKATSYSRGQGYLLTIPLKPVCNAPSPSTFYATAGYRMYTQQPDTNFQIHFEPSSYSQIETHVNPVVYVTNPEPINPYSNLISFEFLLCDTYLYDATNGWVAFENQGGDTLDLSTCSLRNINTNQTYYGHLYNSGDGILYNVGIIATTQCDTLIFSAYIDSSSSSCPPPKDSGVGTLSVRCGNVCNDTLLYPDSNTCENTLYSFNYVISANDLVLDTTGHSPDTVSLCDGTLTENFTITSASYGTISNPLFWVTLPPGVSVENVTYMYPCPGGRDTTILTHDTVSLGGARVGWKLNKDLHIHGLPGLSRPGSHDTIVDSLNSVCITVTLKMSCRYDSANYIGFTASGISTCSELLTQSINLRPNVDSSCCKSCKLAVSIDAADTLLCVGSTTTANAIIDTSGTPPYTYLWNPGRQTNSTATGLAAGSYTVTVTDSKGCFDTAKVVIHADSFSVSFGTPTILCFGDSAIVMATVLHGYPPFAYFWSNGNTTSSIFVNAGGYTVTVTDSIGCNQIDSITITQPSLLNGLIQSLAVHCDTSGTIYVVASGGTSPYVYNWSTGQTRDTITGLSAGIYSVTITDGNSCSVVVIDTLSLSPLSVNILASPYICFGDSTNAIAQITNGEPPYLYVWSNGSTTSSIYLQGGSYTVTVIDSAGCLATAQVNITVDTLPIISGPLYACGDTLTFFVTNPVTNATYNWAAINGSILSTTVTGDTATGTISSGGGSVIVIETISFPDGSSCTMADTLNIRACCADTTYDTIISNARASAIRTPFLSYSLKHILIEGTFTVDEKVTFDDCDVEFMPDAMINIVNNSTLSVQNCSHLHASKCDTMWRGMFIHPGSELIVGDGPLVEDADSAVVAINGSPKQGTYILAYSYFNKNYKNVVTEPYNGTYSGTVGITIFTCRNLDNYHCPDTDWHSKPFTTLLYPHLSKRTYIGMDFDSVQNFALGIPFSNAGNTFDNMEWGIHAIASNLAIGDERFEYIGSAASKGAAIYSQGTLSPMGNSLLVGGIAYGDTNFFLHCYRGVMGYEYIRKFYVSNNLFNYITDRGISDFKSRLPGSIAFIDSNKIQNADVSINAALNANINAFIDGNTMSSTCSSIGVKLQEAGGPGNYYYVVENDTITASCGILVNGLHGAQVYNNTINLLDCRLPLYEYGIRITNNDSSKFIYNTIAIRDTADTATGIYSHLCPNCNILCNSDTNMKYGISIWNNSAAMSILNNSGNNPINYSLATGMYFNTALGIMTQGTLTNPTNNTWNGTFKCNSNVAVLPIPTFWYNLSSPIYNPTFGSSCVSVFANPSSCSICPPTQCGEPPPPIILSKVPLDSIATGQIPISPSPDSVNVAGVAQEGLGDVIMQNPVLLSDSLLSSFNDSLQAQPLGQLMQIDTMLSSAANWNGTTMGLINGISPTYNIDSNRQLTAQAYLTDLMYDSLSLAQINALRGLAKKCPLWEGKAVFKARALLELYDSAETLYLDTNCNCNPAGENGGHRPRKRNNGDSSSSTINPQFNLYPNPNNGGFTLEYQLTIGQIGEFEIFDLTGKKLADYSLNASEIKMNFNEDALDNGVYLYKIIVDNNAAKIDKLVIIK
jgi:hypothetical protein